MKRTITIPLKEYEKLQKTKEDDDIFVSGNGVFLLAFVAGVFLVAGIFIGLLL